MNDAALQARVAVLVERACAGHQVEGPHVELKADWPLPKEAARIVAAMCNAAGGDPVLLIVGVDERQRVVRTPTSQEIANWWPQAEKEFDRESPSMLGLSSVHVGDHTVVAMVFDSSRAPYVIKNPVYGSPNGGPVMYEVPWRVGNSNRSARREHLLRMIVPAAGVPSLELLSGSVQYMPGERQNWQMSGNFEVFASVQRAATLVGHRTRIAFDPPQLGPLDPRRIERTFLDSFNLLDAARAQDLNRASSFRFLFSGVSACIGPVLPAFLHLQIEFAIDRTDRTAPLMVRLRQQSVADELVEFEADL